MRMTGWLDSYRYKSEALVLSRVRAGFYHQLYCPVKAAGGEERSDIKAIKKLAGVGRVRTATLGSTITG